MNKRSRASLSDQDNCASTKRSENSSSNRSMLALTWATLSSSTGSDWVGVAEVAVGAGVGATATIAGSGVAVNDGGCWALLEVWE